jgi:hypothetical protein
MSKAIQTKDEGHVVVLKGLWGYAGMVAVVTALDWKW